MKLLEDRIRKDGKIIGTEILKVDSFLNHQLDVALFREMAREWKRRFEGTRVTKILTIEASGIAMAVIAAEAFGDCPVVFAKKSRTSNLPDDAYTTKVASFTHGKTYDVLVSKRFLTPDDSVLVIDDFLANGEALSGLIDLVRQSGGTVSGCCIAIEKAFQGGGEKIRSLGYRVESLAKIASMNGSSIEFED